MRRPTMPQIPEPPVELTVPRDEAEAKIADRIRQGTDLLNLPINQQEQLVAAKKRYSLWTSYNYDLLKSLFTTERLASEYHSWDRYIGVGSDYDDPTEQLRRFKETLTHQVEALESIKERLELWPVAQSAMKSVAPAPTAKPFGNEDIKKEKSVSDIEIFISHSGKDASVATKLADLLKAAFSLSPDAILCTSVEGHRLKGGAKTEDTLRSAITDAKLLIGLLTPNSLESAWVLFELGARWGLDGDLIPVLASGTEPFKLVGPLAGRNALSCQIEAQVYQLVADTGNILARSPHAPNSYLSQVKALVEASETVPQKEVATSASIPSEASYPAELSEAAALSLLQDYIQRQSSDKAYNPFLISFSEADKELKFPSGISCKYGEVAAQQEGFTVVSVNEINIRLQKPKPQPKRLTSKSVPTSFSW